MVVFGGAEIREQAPAREDRLLAGGGNTGWFSAEEPSAIIAALDFSLARELGERGRDGWAARTDELAQEPV